MMFFVFYKRKHSRSWRSQAEPFARRSEAQRMCDQLLSYRATAGQQEYSHAVAKFVDLD